MFLSSAQAELEEMFRIGNTEGSWARGKQNGSDTQWFSLRLGGAGIPQSDTLPAYKIVRLVSRLFCSPRGRVT